LLPPELPIPLTAATAPREALPAATPARQRRRPLYILGAACVIALTAGAFRMHERFPRHVPHIPPSPALTRALTPLPVALAPARAAVEAATRPSLDRRILLAVADLHHMVTGIDRRDAEAVFAGGEWIVRHLDVEVGRLPEFASFADGLRLLRTWAVRLEGPGATTSSTAAPEREPPMEQDAFALLRAAQRSWSPSARDAQAMRDASCALAALSFAMLDEMEVGDVLPGRALASLVLAEKRGDALPRSKAILAHAMGYEREARELASVLPASDGTRDFLDREDASLARSAQRADSSIWTRYLWLRRLIDLGESGAERRFLAERLAELAGSAAIDRHALSDVTDMRAQGIVDALPRVREALLSEIQRERADPATQESAAGRTVLRALDLPRSLWDSTRSEPLLARFDRAAARAAATGAGPFYDPSLVQAYFRASLFTGFLRIERWWGSSNGLDELARFGKLLHSEGSVESVDVARWHKELQPLRTALDDDPRPVEALASIVSLGHGPLLMLQDEVADAVGGGKPDKLRAIRLLAARFDTRPEHRRFAAWHAHHYSLDMPEAKRICRALLPVAAGGFELLAGLANPADWPQVRPQEAAEVVAELRGLRDHVIVNVGAHTEDLTRFGAADRYGVTREVLGAADVVVGVGMATPVGVARLVAWIADVVVLAPGRPVHLVVNKAPASRFVRGEVEAEILRNFTPASLHLLPLDPGVEKAAWRGELVAPGPFTRAVEGLADVALAPAAPGGTVPGHRTEPRAALRRRKGPA